MTSPEAQLAVALGGRTFGANGVGSTPKNGAPAQLEALAALPLAKHERRICELLARHFQHFVSCERVVDYVFADDPDGGPENAENVIRVTVLRTRAKLDGTVLAIESANGSGYRLVWSGATAPIETPAPAVQTAPVQLRPRPAPAPLPALRPGDIELGTSELGVPIGLDLGKLIEGRLLIQGASGAGKSWTLRRLLEQTARSIQQIVVDPEGEFRELGERLGLERLEGHRLDLATLAIAAARAREHRISLVLDLSELEREDQMKAIAAFVPPLVAAPREQWTPCLVAVDEAHLFAPHGGFSDSTAVRKASIAALTDLMSRGRKRGLGGVVATQRLARLAKSVVSEALNYMVGLNTLDLDIARAAETIGWEKRKAFDRLPMLEPGNFVAVGPAFSQSPVTFKVGPVETRHAGAAPAIGAPPRFDPGAAAQCLDLDALMAASAADQELIEETRMESGLRQVRAFIREQTFADSGRIWGVLQSLAPHGVRVPELAAHLGRPVDDVAAALDLLDRYGTIEFMGEGNERAVRIERGMR